MSKRTGKYGYVNDYVSKEYPSGISSESRKLASRHGIEVRKNDATPDKFPGTTACACCEAPAITKRRVGRSGNRLAPVCGSRACRMLIDRADLARIDMTATTSMPEIV